MKLFEMESRVFNRKIVPPKIPNLNVFERIPKITNLISVDKEYTHKILKVKFKHQLKIDVKHGDETIHFSRIACNHQAENILELLNSNDVPY
jgi:hypothetical protein